MLPAFLQLHELRFLPMACAIPAVFCLRNVPSNRESHCFSINEAWLAGVPVVSCDYLVNRRFEERHGPLMWLVPPRPDPARLAAALREAYEGRHDPRVAPARNVASREYVAPVIDRRGSDLCQHVLHG